MSMDNTIRHGYWVYCKGKSCAEKMDYYLRNKHTLSECIASLSLENRIRVLLRLPLKGERCIDKKG